jgi:glutathione synthase/RimK-type ligase-like ATP-grasp enzyme
MRICVLLPDHCKDYFVSRFSNFIVENGKEQGYDIHLITNPDDLQKNDLVLFRFGADFDGWKYETTEQTSIQLSTLIHRLESKGCICYPNSYMMQFYENKVKLDTLFNLNDIHIPETHVFTRQDPDKITDVSNFPVIVKWAYSCSSNGINQAYNQEELFTVLSGLFKLRNECAIVQKKILTLKEARISYYGSSIFHGYYRYRNTIEQVSAATRFGSYVDFHIDLEKYRPFIEGFIRKTGMIQGGIDLIWENGDESKEPFVLEVSPIFDINPPLPEDWKECYASFKKSPIFDDHWVKTLKDSSKIFLDYAIREYNKPRLYIDIDNTITNSHKRVFEHPTDYMKAECYMKDTVYDNFLRFFNSNKNKYTIHFITARASYENAFLNTQNWLLNQNLPHSGLIIVNSLQEKIDLFERLTNIDYIWFDDCTHSHHLEKPLLDDNILKQIKEKGISHVLISSENDWNSVELSI